MHSKEEANNFGRRKNATICILDSTFLVTVICDELNIRKEASFKSEVVGMVKKGEVFTIVEEKNGLGKLKSGTGWISMGTKYVQKK
jgi:Bacterial SH3 domain.